MVTIPTTALESEADGVRPVNPKLVKRFGVPPAQDSVQEYDTKNDLNGASDGDHEEIPSVDDVVQVRGDQVIDLSDKVSTLLSGGFLFFPLDARLVRLRWGSFGGEGRGGTCGSLGSIG